MWLRTSARLLLDWNASASLSFSPGFVYVDLGTLRVKGVGGGGEMRKEEEEGERVEGGGKCGEERKE